jgi:glycosyltransferase involved in cell wall biosynthesis
MPRRVDRTLIYQRYYLAGLERVASVQFKGEPLLLKLASSAERKVDVERKLQPVFGRLREPRSSAHVGVYDAALRGNTIRFAIDAHDAREVRSPDALAESDVYFKANLWPADRAADKVAPIVNGNGLLGARERLFLRALRECERDLDLVFVSRVWGGREHNLRLFEQAASLPVKSRLHAIFPQGTPDDEAIAGMRRLAALGVTVGTKDIPPADLWRLLARSKVTLLRAGKHLCIPWRMLDLLCMGSAIVVDAPFGPQWPEPLRAGVNYVDAGLHRPADTSPAPADEYDRVADAIIRTLAESDLMADMRIANARYFDEHADPERVAASIVRRVTGLLGG